MCFQRGSRRRCFRRAARTGAWAGRVQAGAAGADGKRGKSANGSQVAGAHPGGILGVPAVEGVGLSSEARAPLSAPRPRAGWAGPRLTERVETTDRSRAQKAPTALAEGTVGSGQPSVCQEEPPRSIAPASFRGRRTTHPVSPDPALTAQAPAAPRRGAFSRALPREPPTFGRRTREASWVR